jgi:hypothetical protein
VSHKLKIFGYPLLQGKIRETLELFPIPGIFIKFTIFFYYTKGGKELVYFSFRQDTRSRIIMEDWGFSGFFRPLRLKPGVRPGILI